MNTCQMGHGVPGSEPWLNDRSQEKLKGRSLLFTDPRESIPHTLRGHVGWSREGAERERIGAHAFIWVHGTAFEGLC